MVVKIEGIMFWIFIVMFFFFSVYSFITSIDKNKFCPKGFYQVFVCSEVITDTDDCVRGKYECFLKGFKPITSPIGGGS